MKWDKSKCVTSAPEDLNVGVTTSVLSSSHCCTQGFSKLESTNGCYNDLLEKDGIICRVHVQDVTPEDFQYILLSSSRVLLILAS